MDFDERNVMPSLGERSPYLGERSRSCVLCNKWIGVNKDKSHKLKEKGLSFLKETAEK